MDSDRHEDSVEMYSPDEQGEYTPLNGALRFSMQGLSNALADVGEGITEPPAEEYVMMLEVMMADHPWWPRLPAFSWNVGMVMHVVKNILVITDHFTRYALTVVKKDQTAKTVVKVFYKWFIAIFGVPVKLLSDRGANFTSTLVKELCATFGIQKCCTTAYHAQCNGQVEHFHQILFHMIGKLVLDKNTQWEQHLLELLQAYNSTWLVVTSFSLHYLMFGRCPHL